MVEEGDDKEMKKKVAAAAVREVAARARDRGGRCWR